MTSATPSYFLFPQTILSEKEQRRLAVFLPRWSTLQVLHPPVVPEWARDRAHPWPAVEDREQLERIRACWREYQDFAALHGENSALAAMSYECISQDTAESRFQIERTVRGKHPQDPALERKRLVEAAVFLEMARDLDEKELDIEAGFDRLARLEQEFNDILGLTQEEDELQEAAEAFRVPLVSARHEGPFMLSRRMGFWLRLFLARQSEAAPVLVCTDPEAAREIIDGLSEDPSLSDWTPEPDDGPLFTIPDPGALDSEQFSACFEALKGSDRLAQFWEALGQAVLRPDEASARERLSRAAQEAEEHVEEFFESKGHTESDRTSLTLTRLAPGSLEQLWKRLDPQGYDEWAENLRFAKQPLVLLTISRSAGWIR